MPKNLTRLLKPASIAVVGASENPEKPGFQMLQAFDKFIGNVYPVNPKGGTMLGRKVFTSLSAIPETIDLVALVVPPNASAEILREASLKGVGAAFMVSGGFSETGDSGKIQQNELLKICQNGNIRLLGPNTSGFINPYQNLSCTFLPAAAKLSAGNIGIVAQSGGINLTLAFLLHEQNLGISLSIGIGNGADVGVSDIVNYLRNDINTDLIIIHLEGVSDGRSLFNTIKSTVQKKPVIVLPVGKSNVGEFAESHTGNLMGSYDLTCSALKQAGAVVVESTIELIDAANVLSKNRLPPIAEPGVGILTGQAGPGLLITDNLREAGVLVPEIGPKTIKKIDSLLPSLTYIKNPVDTGRPLQTFGQVGELLATDKVIDAVLVYALYEKDSIDFSAEIIRAAKASKKPFIFATQGLKTDTEPVSKILSKNGIITLNSPDRAALAMRALVDDARAQHRLFNQRGRLTGKRPALNFKGTPDEAKLKDFLDTLGIPTPSRFVCGSHSNALKAFKKLRPNVVVKILDAEVIHKTEVNGVHVAVNTIKALKSALNEIDKIKSQLSNRRYLIEEMAGEGLDILVGARRDKSWGPVVLLGMGGIMAEALGDVAIRTAPIDLSEANKMIKELKTSALFDQFRGRPSRDKEAVAALIVTIGNLVNELTKIEEFELNPVRVFSAGKGLMALDALAVISK